MSEEPEVTRQELIDAIAAYLVRSPAAADTARGIADWWMSAMGLDVSPEEVSEALEALLQRGVVECNRLPGGTPVYRATQARH